ncbi:MAG: BNR/Asp-box repeat domain protein [Labilithrix sp.]|nr:BNR/Asp-box repeat domain protein [Labilithrix sp.]
MRSSLARAGQHRKPTPGERAHRPNALSSRAVRRVPSFSAASLISAAVLAATIGSTSLAHANGRFPESNQISFAAHDPDLVILRVTFGLLISHDRGRTFQWVCEQSIGFSGVEDPMYTVTPSNAIVGTTFQGLTMTHDNACGWTFAGGPLENQVFIDLSASPTDPKNIVVFASSYDSQDDAGNINFKSLVWETKDEAQTFQQLGQTLDPALLGYTIDLTATDPDRMYITAVREPGTTPKGVLLVSKNHGQTWEEEAVPLVGTERAVFVAAVDPTNPERVYLRTSNTVDKPTRLIVREATDGGPATQRTVHEANGALLGFALSRDGSKVYIGGPKDGVKVASTQDFNFQQRANVEVQCLALSNDGLWACSNEQSGFIAGLSTDDGATFEPRLRFCDISGPLSTCGPGTPTNDRCAPLWPAQKALLGCGGGTDAGGDGGPGTPGGGSPPVSPPRNGCDCHAAPAAGPWGALVTVLGAAVALVRRARRKR